jgi:hypothetical protein
VRRLNIGIGKLICSIEEIKIINKIYVLFGEAKESFAALFFLSNEFSVTCLWKAKFSRIGIVTFCIQKLAIFDFKKMMNYH